MDFSDITIIVVAAGTGSRFGADMPKQYLDMRTSDGIMPVIIATLKRMTSIMPDAKILVVVSAMWEEHMAALLDRYNLSASVRVVCGGATRTDSVSNALQHIGDGCKHIGVHDGVRPLVTNDVITDAIDAIRNGDCVGAIPAIEVTDSLRLLCSGGVSEPVDRSRYRAVQTPQFFKADALIDAYSHRDPDCTFTDDASVLAAAGQTAITLTKGSPYNIKITHPLDIKIAEIYSQTSIINK